MGKFRTFLAGARAYDQFRRGMMKNKGRSYLNLPEALSFFKLPASGEVLITGESGVGKTGLVFTLCEVLTQEGFPVLYYDLDRSMLGANLDVDQSLFRVFTDPEYKEFAAHLASTKSLGQVVVVLSGASNLLYDTHTPFDRISKHLFEARGGETLILCVERTWGPGFDVHYELEWLKNYREEGQVQYVSTRITCSTPDEQFSDSFLTHPGGRLSKGGMYLKRLKEKDPMISMLQSFTLPNGRKVRGGMNLIRAVDEGEFTWQTI